MIKLTDLELCKKIAEIELKPLNEDMKESGCVESEYTAPKNYNPFEWSLLGPLMVKHEVDTEFFNGANSGCTRICKTKEQSISVVIGESYFDDKTGLPRAILECIVEANS